MRVKKL